MIETGKILQQRYRIEKQIGQGGMGAVYVATDERFGSTVAIKETLCMDDNYRRAIEREARLLNSLKHVALPRVSDHFLEDDGQYLVMEYIPGEDLFCVMEETNEPFPVEQVLNWADQLLEALDFLHNQENPIVHRDIKPQNLKVTAKGQIILLDFGLAKGNVTGASNHTNAKSIFGYSRNYASLEQIQGTGTDPRSDLYSLAATLYHLLTNVAPEDALTRAMAVLSQKPDPLVPANQVNPNVPAGVSAILYKTMDLDAAQRPATAAEMRSMLRDHPSYATLALNTVSVARGSGTGDIHDQKTKLMPGATFNEGNRATHAKTEILPEYASQVTAIRPLAGSRQTGDDISFGSMSKSGKPKKFAAAGAVLLLMLGSAAGGAYVFRENLFGPERRAVPTVSNPEPQQDPVAEPSLQPEQAASAANTESPEAAEPSSVQPPESAVATKRPDAQRKARGSNAPEAESDPDEFVFVDPDDGEKVVIKKDGIHVGDMKVQNGKVYMPDGRVYEMQKTPTTPLQPGARVSPRIPPIDMRHLTPEQRRKLRMLKEQYPDAFPAPIPPPSPKPKATNQ
jgi:serine/threonine protein kinase